MPDQPPPREPMSRLSQPPPEPESRGWRLFWNPSLAPVPDRYSFAHLVRIVVILAVAWGAFEVAAGVYRQQRIAFWYSGTG
jgi:hypothetical protein